MRVFLFALLAPALGVFIVGVAAYCFVIALVADLSSPGSLGGQ